MKRRLVALPIWTVARRIRLLRALGARIGNRCSVQAKVFISHPENLTLGDGAAINRECYINSDGRVTIEDGVRIGFRTIIITADHTIADSTMRSVADEACNPMPVRIGRGTRIMANVTILPGITIGEGCVVGAGSVVSRDLPPNGKYAGNPARLLSELPTRNLQATFA